MQEANFLKKNAQKWQEFEYSLSRERLPADELYYIFTVLTDDLAFARSNFPKSRTSTYLNGLATKAHQRIYKNKREKSGRFVNFWLYELPLLFYESRRAMQLSLLIFLVAVGIGVISAANDETFVRLILGDYYVNMTIENIRSNDPMAVYKSRSEIQMFLGITLNNIRVAFTAFGLGILASFGTAYILLINGIMLGAFQYFFFEYDLLFTSALTIWIHGTLEIAAIVVSGGAGITMGNALLFPGTYPRLYALKQGAFRGTKIVIGLVPVFIIAGFLESFITRLTDAPILFKLLIILGSAAALIYYFGIYPYRLLKRGGLTESKTKLG